MIEINLSESAGVVRPLFKETVTDGPRLFSALNNHHPAIALVDSVDNPHWCVLRSSWFGCTFIGGEIKPDILGLAIQQLRKTGNILLNLADPRAASFPLGATDIERRVEFYNRPSDDPSIDRLIASIPSKLNVRPVTHYTFNHCIWRDQLLSLYGTVSDYLERSIGFLLLVGEQIISEAHAFFWGDTLVEIGVITADGHRGLGYASIVSAHIIRACEDRGYLTYWGCNADNLASIAVARKLGYRIENNYSNAYYPAT
jgi:RimJ/RimL family protein N-acetyltransferase